LATNGPAKVATLDTGKVEILEIAPADAGLEICDIAELKGGDAEFNAEALTTLLEGKSSAYRNTVLFTSAAALIIAGRAADLKEGAEIAAASIDNGQARAALDRMIEISHEPIPDPEEEYVNE
jgi:anthranilate phosphoribosyltransferase